MPAETSDTLSPPALSVYWQPGCSSCLRAKEFLRTHDIEFISVNVLEDKSAMRTLTALGARSIPVVCRGKDFVYAQDLDVLAGFVGIELQRQVLPMDALVTRIDLLLAATQRYLAQLPEHLLLESLPGRERSYLDLGYHILVIPRAFIDAANGTLLSYDYFERRPPPAINSTAALIELAAELRASLQNWWRLAASGSCPDKVLTYYGEHTTHSVLERSAWHTAQHVRQLMGILQQHDIVADGPLGEAELAGLPLPDAVYDDEAPMTNKS